MMKRLAFAAAVLVAGLAVSPAHAQSGDGVFQIMKATEDRVWRLNTQTGEIAVCALEGENLVCTTSSDAAEVPKKSYEEIAAARAAEQEAAEQAAEEQRAQDLRMLDKMFELFREFLNTALGREQ